MAHPRSTWLAIGLLTLASLGSACDRSQPNPPATTPGGTATPAPPASAASK